MREGGGFGGGDQVVTNKIMRKNHENRGIWLALSWWFVTKHVR